MKKADLLKMIKALEDRIERLENRQHVWKYDKASDLECEGGCQFPMHYYSPDGKYPCTKCGRIIQHTFITWTC